MFDTKQKVLPNGIRLITIKKDTQVTSIHAGIKIGAIFESPSEKGISHFIEHMLFKGTKTRNNEKLNFDLEALGGEYNAYTDNDCTVYSITALSEELEKSLELLSDMLRESIFPEEEIDKERDVILAEIRTSKDDIEDYSFKKINEMAFDKSPLKYETIGDEKTVNKINKAKLVKFYDKYYVPNNCVISIVSPYEHEYIYELVWKYFKEWIWKEFKRKKVIIENNIPGLKISYKKDIEQSTVIYLFTFYDITKEEELALRILNHKFGESANSILFRKLREEKGLAYDVYTDLDLTTNVKTLYIYTAVSNENVDETIETIDNCIEEIKNEKIIFDDNTIMLMKKVLKTAVAFTLEDSTDIGNYVLHQAIDEDDIFKFIDDMKKLENIKKDDIYKVARLVFKNPAVHILKSEDTREEQ
ncbi:insulinase family protein [Clostridiaceae bacterium UIB06]|uniref:Insulinase family protein n=1 Tax=Clostridium thailandense TaxID=2794346 RepID=A0A949TXN7_9CLOT|nr:pitrilysin family protein [Clostridium thailandense]MBV7275471.1 insulinase family protein [Clostridium thailandense]MCH5136667.1 insulinase family protein [Clostridiaceae bacterium UIB06]